MMKVQLLAVLLVISIFYHGVHGGEVPSGYALKADKACVGDNLLAKPLRLDVPECAYDCMINPECAAFVLEPVPNKTPKCYHKSNCDSFTDVPGLSTYTIESRRDQNEDPPSGYTTESSNPTCVDDNSIILHGGENDRVGCAHACEVNSNCVGIALYSDDTVRPRCKRQIKCHLFTYKGAVYSKGTPAPPPAPPPAPAPAPPPPAPAPPPAPSNPRDAFAAAVSNEDCWFNDISHLYSMEDCLLQCKDNGGCVAVVSNGAETECWQKSQCAGGWTLLDRKVFYKLEDDAPATSNPRDAFGAAQSNVDCWFNDIDHLWSIDACLTSCRDNAACVAIVTTGSENECWTKSYCAGGWTLLDRKIYYKKY